MDRVLALLGFEGVLGRVMGIGVWCIASLYVKLDASLCFFPFFEVSSCSVYLLPLFVARSDCCAHVTGLVGWRVGYADG